MKATQILAIPRLAVVLGSLTWILLSGCAREFANGNRPVERMTHDAGVVEPDAVMRHTFVVENSSSKPIRIVDIRSTCSCTTASIEKGTEISAHGKREIELTYDVGGRTGGLGAQMLLVTDSPQRGNILLSMECKASGAIEWYPGRVKLGPEDPTQEVTVWDAKFEAFKVTEVTSADPTFRFTFEPFTGDHGHRSNVPGWRVAVFIDEQARAGHVESEMRIATTSALRPEIVVPIVADVEGDLFVDPPSVYWGILKDDSQKRSTINIRRRGANAATVTSITVDQPAVGVSMRLISPEHMTSDVIATAVIAIVNDEVERGKAVRATVRIATSSERVPELVIPVSFLVK